MFRTESQYKGNTTYIKHRRVCVKPLRSRLEAIQKFPQNFYSQGSRSFVGILNLLSMFCPQLQKLLKSIYDLTRRGRQFIWKKDHQIVFEEIKWRLIKPPVLHLPNSTCRFHLYSDTNKFAMGRALYQIQNGNQS